MHVPAHRKPRKENALNILRFQTNTPAEVALNSPQGTIVEGRYGEFSEKHNLNIPAIVRRLNLKPIIRVEAEFFVAYLHDQRYVLCKAEAGVRPAVREALQLRQENQSGREIAS
jgi:hypothetical protein